MKTSHRHVHCFWGVCAILLLIPCLMSARDKSQAVKMEVTLASGSNVTLIVEFLYHKEGVETFLGLAQSFNGKAFIDGKELDPVWVENFMRNAKQSAISYFIPIPPPITKEIVPKKLPSPVTVAEPKPVKKRSEGTEIPSAVQDAAKSVALITTPSGSGSGFLMEKDGQVWIVTNIHVVMADCAIEDIAIAFEEGQTCKAKEIRYSDEHDVALLLPDQVLPMAALKRAGSPPERDAPVFAIGNSHGRSVNLILPGTVQGLGNREGVVLIESDADFVRGNSGGPLLISNGGVVGINTSGEDPSKEPDAQGTVHAKKGRRWSQCIDVIDRAKSQSWGQIRAWAANMNLRAKVIAQCESLFRPDNAFWNYESKGTL